MNPCIKTGANIWVKSEGAALHGDLFRIGSTYFMEHVGFRFDVPESECDATWMDTVHPAAAFLNRRVFVVPVECRDFSLSDSFKQWRKQYE